MAPVTHMYFPFSHTNTNTTFFPKPLITFLTCFNRGERQKYTGKKVHLNQVSNSQPLRHESDIIILMRKKKNDSVIQISRKQFIIVKMSGKMTDSVYLKTTLELLCSLILICTIQNCK